MKTAARTAILFATAFVCFIGLAAPVAGQELSSEAKDKAVAEARAKVRTIILFFIVWQRLNVFMRAP